MARKFQIPPSKDIAVELKREATRRETSPAEIVRETMRENRATRKSPLAGHTFAAIIGIVEDGEPDLSARVDELIYQSRGS